MKRDNTNRYRRVAEAADVAHLKFLQAKTELKKHQDATGYRTPIRG